MLFDNFIGKQSPELDVCSISLPRGPVLLDKHPNNNFIIGNGPFFSDTLQKRIYMSVYISYYEHYASDTGISFTRTCSRTVAHSWASRYLISVICLCNCRWWLSMVNFPVCFYLKILIFIETIILSYGNPWLVKWAKLSQVVTGRNKIQNTFQKCFWNGNLTLNRDDVVLR